MKKALLSLTLVCSFVLTSCSMLIDKQVNKFSASLSNAITNFDDPETIAAALPTLLIVLESAARSDDASGQLKLSAAQMYGAYSGAFVTEGDRQQALSKRGFNYAKVGSCKVDKRWCDIDQANNEDFNNFIAQLKEKDIATTYAYANAWLNYIQAHSDDWTVVAQLSRAKSLLEVVIEHNEAYDNAGAHLYLGAVATILPPAIGGKPEVGKAHFERAIELTEGNNLAVKVEYARRYARTVFDQELHHQLLQEVIQANAEVPGMTLMNVWAKQQAQELLATESDYFD